MKQLSILRHAKSSHADADMADFDRPLNDCGWKSARRIGRELKRRNIHFDLVLASPAARVRETVDGLREKLELDVEIRFESLLYLATVATLLKAVREVPDQSHSLLLVGHNPGLQQFILELTRRDRQGWRNRVAEKFPTSAFARIELLAPRWSEVSPCNGHIAEFIVPKQLT